MTRLRRSELTSKNNGAEPVRRAVLDNGLAVVLCPRHHIAQAFVTVLFGVGSRHEGTPNNGITHFLEHMLFRGTKSYRDPTALNAAAEAFGGFLMGATYRDHVDFSTNCHASAVNSAIEILAELVNTPRYRGLEVERSILQEELLETVDRDGRMIDIDNISHRAVFGDHGLGLPIEGTLDNVGRIGRPELEAHRREFLVANNCVVGVSGPIDPDRALHKIERAFREMSSGSAPICAVPPPPRPEPIVRYVRDASSQVDIRVSFRAAPVHDEGYPSLVMLGRLLGDGLASRMNAELVDRRGLAYALHAGLTTYSDTGLFEFDVSVAPNRAAEAVQAILDFAGSASRFRFTDEEKDRVRRRYRYGIEFMGDSPNDLASWHGRATLFGIERQTAAVGSKIARLEDAAIRRAARKYFTREGLVLVAVGELVRGEWGRVREVVKAWRP